MEALLTKEERILVGSRYGYLEEASQGFYLKWIRLRYSGKARGCKVLLTFDQYLKLAAKAKLKSPDEIGKAKHLYQMGRVGDTGDYIWGNCRFITQQQNQNEMTINGGRRLGDLKRSMSLKGRTKETHPYINKQAQKISRSFVAVSPSGKKYRSRNVRAFEREHGLTGFDAVLRGKCSHRKGWTGYYVDKDK